MDPREVPDKTLGELMQEEDNDLRHDSMEEAREELEDYYQARDELDTMIVATEQALEGVITMRGLVEELNSLYEGVEDDTLALDRI